MRLHDSVTLPIHPRTGRSAVGIVNGKPVWPILGASDEPPAPPAPPEPPPTYTAPASQADLDRIIETRLARERARFSDYDDLKTAKERLDALELDLASDKDKAVAEARKDERTKATSEATPRVVRSEFKAAAKGVLTDEQLTALLEDLDLSKYVTDKGDVDEEKVGKKVAAFAPTGNGKQPPPRTLGQGKQPGMQTQPGDQGRAMAEKRFGAKKP